MAITGNKGEWSEIYALLKLLGDGKVHAGDARLNKLDIYYPIISILRQERSRLEFKPNQIANVAIIADGVEVSRMPMSTFVQHSETLLSGIKAGGNRAFCVPDAESFMRALGCERIKAPSHEKSDIAIVIHDLRTGMTPRLDFSIKSQLGSPSTLLNAGKSTNITYRVEGGDVGNLGIDRVNAIESQVRRMEAILASGARLQFERVDNDIFRNNLLFIDFCLPQIVADCLAAGCLPGGKVRIADLTESIAASNPLNYSGGNASAFYEHKMKSLLLTFALGMTPAKEWTGRYDANGGYLVVRADGEIVCYHFYNVNDVEDYLYHNTRLEFASRSRYGWGSLYEDEDGVVRIKLNLQIRFNK